MRGELRYAADADDLKKQGDAAPGMAWFEVTVEHECPTYTVYYEANTEDEAANAAEDADRESLYCDHSVGAWGTELPGTRMLAGLTGELVPAVVNCEGQLTIDDAAPSRAIEDVAL